MVVFLKKINYLLSSTQKKKLIFLFFLALVGVLFETLGIGLVIPMFKIITDPSILDKYPILSFLTDLSPFNWFLGESHDMSVQGQLITGAIIMVIIVYSLKACFLIFLSWKQNTFVTNLGIHWSEKLFSGYLHLPYSFYLQKNSALLIRNVNQAFILAATVELTLTLITEILVIFGITSLLIITEPLGAIVVIVIFLLSGFYFQKFTKKYLTSWGEKRHFYDGQRIKHMQQGFGGAKDLKLLGREKNFSGQFLKHNSASAIVSRNQRILKTVPRLWLEIMVVVSLSFLLFLMLINNQTINNVIPTLGLFAAASFRLMPSVNKILANIQSLSYEMPSVNNVYKELTETTAQNVTINKKNEKINFNKFIKLENVNYTYQGSHKSVLNGININIPHGCQAGFVGESGSGKSTLIDIILGLLSPSNGSVKVDDVDIQKNLRSWQSQIGYVPQEIFLTDDTLRNNIAFAISRDKILDKSMDEAIAAANLSEFVESLPDGLNTMVGERGVRLSGGQRQRIGIARALYHKPKVLVLDEATSSLDLETEREIMEGVFKLKGDKTILIIAHRLSTVSKCDELFKINNGKIVQKGTFKEVVDH